MKIYNTLHRSGGKYYVYVFRLMEDAEVVEILKSAPLRNLEIQGMNLAEYVQENIDDFAQPYVITKEKSKWKCTCPWGMYKSDIKPCWHVNTIPSIMLTPRINESWAEWAEEAAKIQRENMEER